MVVLLITLAWLVASLVCAPLLGRALREVERPGRAPSAPRRRPRPVVVPTRPHLRRMAHAGPSGTIGGRMRPTRAQRVPFFDA